MHADIALKAADYQLEEDEDFENYVFPEELADTVLKLPIVDIIDINDLDIKNVQPIDVIHTANINHVDKKFNSNRSNAGQDHNISTVQIKNNNGFNDMSIKELREAANKIISGTSDTEIDVDIKGEIGELLRLIIDAKNKVDDINPALSQSVDNVPHISSSLQEVNDTTEKASLDIMQAVENMQSFYKSFATDIDNLKSLVIDGKDQEFNIQYDAIISKLSGAVELGFKILEALEFQDITEQKLRKVIKSMQDMGSRLGAIIGYLHVNGSKDGKSPKDIEKLLSDYGLA